MKIKKLFFFNYYLNYFYFGKIATRDFSLVIKLYDLYLYWGLGIGDWGLGIAPNPKSPIPNPQSPF